jgi:translation elongation factor EF-1beta
VHRGGCEELELELDEAEEVKKSEVEGITRA